MGWCNQKAVNLPGADYFTTNQYLWDGYARSCTPGLPAAKRNGVSENATSCKTFAALFTDLCRA
ncbi:hypothetical protein SY86_08325 [Erwinia tracheiphila]|uniref:Uncharacterized protein n=1 Tax=Erwinia tracheiphila TaxID=65700 RepID=A0A0M2KDP2_9GAMM|nr:hypothetical protein AV903_13235 [Erwinia tracheiphila]KKF35427.1 hypothetical protein SY86_08325 [Erwinia tracheiphila]